MQSPRRQPQTPEEFIWGDYNPPEWQTQTEFGIQPQQDEPDAWRQISQQQQLALQPSLKPTYPSFFCPQLMTGVVEQPEVIEIVDAGDCPSVSSPDDDSDEDPDYRYREPPEKKRKGSTILRITTPPRVQPPPTKPKVTRKKRAVAANPPTTFATPSVTTVTKKRTVPYAQWAPAKKQAYSGKMATQAKARAGTIAELREMVQSSMAEQQDARSVIEETLDQLRKSNIPLDPKAYITQLSDMVAHQQAVIHSLNVEQFNLGAQQRIEIFGIESKYRAELDEQRNLLQAAKAHELEMKAGVDADVERRTNRLSATINDLNASLATERERVSSLKQRLAEAAEALEREKQRNVVDEEEGPEPPVPIQLTEKKRQKHQQPPPTPVIQKQWQQPRPPVRESALPKMKREAEMVPDDERYLYSWSVLQREPERCLSLYGFTARQLVVIRDYVGVKPLTSAKKRQTGHLSGITTETRLLFILHFLTRYVSIQKLYQRFNIATSTLAENLNAGIEVLAPLLIERSLSHERETRFAIPMVYHTYFFPMFAPTGEHGVGSRYYNREWKCYGVYVHYIVEPLKGKAVIHTVDTDTTWQVALDSGARRATEEDDDGGFAQRMACKFLIMGAKYRGCIEDIASVVQLVIALTNLDIIFGNPIVEQLVNEVQADGE